MTTRKKADVISTDELIAKLQRENDKLRDNAETERFITEDLRKARDANYNSADGWKKEAEKKSAEIKDLRRQLSESEASRLIAERQLAYAEGVIAALKGEDYKPFNTSRVEGPTPW